MVLSRSAFVLFLDFLEANCSEPISPIGYEHVILFILLFFSMNCYKHIFYILRWVNRQNDPFNLVDSIFVTLSSSKGLNTWNSQLPWLGLQWPCCKGRRRAARTECRVESLVVFQKFRPWWMFTLKLKLVNLDDYFLTRLDTESSSFASFGKFFGSFRLKLFFTHPHINSGWWQLKYFLLSNSHPYLGKMILFDSYFSNGLKPPTSFFFSVMD